MAIMAGSSRKISDPGLQLLFSRAYILGGSPCSGKSSLAEMLSTAYGFRYYKVDDHDQAHLQRCQSQLQPVMVKYASLSWNEVWSQPVGQLLADELACYRERFQFILDDLRQLDPRVPVLLEGAAFLPELIDQFSPDRQRVLFMVPEVEFQVWHYRQRPWIGQILNECQHPEQAFEHWMKRDELFGQEVIRQAAAYGFSVMRVDGSLDIDATFAALRVRFGLS